MVQCQGYAPSEETGVCSYWSIFFAGVRQYLQLNHRTVRHQDKIISSVGFLKIIRCLNVWQSDTNTDMSALEVLSQPGFRKCFIFHLQLTRGGKKKSYAGLSSYPQSHEKTLGSVHCDYR